MIVFLSCTAAKKTKRCKACEMYADSDLFSKAYKYAKKLNPDKILILSAKHHVLELDDVIEPYDLTLKDMSVDERKEWSKKVIDILKDKNINFDQKVYFCAGEDYIEFLKDEFKNRVEVFDNKGGIGYIMQYLDKQVSENLSDYLKKRLIF